MTAKQLAEGYRAYTHADELAAEAGQPRDPAEADPTTSIYSTICIQGAEQEAGGTRA